MSSQEFLQYILADLLTDVEGISSRRMFGGFGLYKHGVIFGIIIDDVLYFKVDDSNKTQYETFASKPFAYSHHGKTVKTSYWEVPSDVIDDKKKLHVWLEQSYLINKQRKSKK